MPRHRYRWSLEGYVKGFFPCNYKVSGLETGKRDKRIAIRVTNTVTRATAKKEGPITDFLDISSMAEIAEGLKAQLKQR